MSKYNANVIGIMIGATDDDYRLYHMTKRWDSSSRSVVEGLKDIIGYLSIELQDDTEFVVVYDVSCPKKETQLKTLLSTIHNKIKKDDLLPSLIAIGHETSPLSADITAQVSDSKEVGAADNHEQLLAEIVSTKLNNIINQQLVDETELNTEITPPVTTTAPHSSSTANFSMMVLSGFITAIGIAAVAVAFTVLNAATLGTAGLVVAGIGIAATLTGIGLFANACKSSKVITPDDSLELTGTLALN